MKNIKLFTFASITLLALGVAVARADMANGTYSYSGSTTVWDISGDYSGDLGLGFGLDFSITQDAFGDFEGNGSFDIEEGGNSLSGDVEAVGKVSGSATDPSVTMDILLSGTGTILVDDFGDTDDVTFDATTKLKLAVDAANGQLVTTSGSVTVSETDLTTGKKVKRSVPLGKGTTLGLPSNTTGDWNLTLNLTPAGTKYTGTASIETSTGGVMDFTATGTYSSKTDTSNIVLKGDGGDLTLVISTSGGSITVNSMKGKVFGQSLSSKAGKSK
jgi:hypothetical protein